MAASPFTDLPPVVRALVPEAAASGDGEARADCARCPMAASTAPHPWSFSPDTRCCTYHPALPNFLAGRALARGGATAELVLARLGDPDGVSARGVYAPAWHLARYHAEQGAGFGRDPALRCPFWVGGEHACGVWHDRPATCRAWFCKHDDGLGGAVAWSQVSFLVAEAEDRVARYLVARGSPPAPGATVAAWADWFRACATSVLTLDEADVAALGSPGLTERRTDLVSIRRRPPRRLADVVVPAVSDRLVDGLRVHLSGYSSFDAVVAPRAVFAFLSRLDGVVPWRDALAAARAATDEPELDEPLVRELHRVGALRAVDGSDDLPFDVEPMPAARWTHAAQRPS